MKTISDIPYVNRPTGPLLMDLYFPDGPATGPLPLIVVIVGGGWSNCKYKEWPESWPTKFGFIVSVIQYRTTDVAIAPANVLDCKAAVRFLRANATTFNIDPSRIGVFGASAGGHLTAILGLTNGKGIFEDDPAAASASSDVQAWCDFCGPTDLSRVARPDVRPQFPGLYDVTARYLGGPVEQRSELARAMSPMTYVSKNVPPGVIVHGKLDTIVPIAESIDLETALNHVGADVSLIILEDGAHTWAYAKTESLVQTFFKRALKVQ